MKSFNIEEKKYLKIITELCKSKDWKNLRFGILMYKIFERAFSFDNPKGFELKDNESSKESESKEYSKAIIDGYIPISVFCNLINYLHKNQLVSLIPLFQNGDFDSTGFGIYKGKGWFQLIDVTFVELIKTNFHYVVYPSQELFDLVENDFKSTELLQFEQELKQTNEHHSQAMESAKKQICYSRWAFVVALVTLLITLGFNFSGTIRVESKSIENRLNQINKDQKLPLVIKTEITNDTINVRVKNIQIEIQNGKNKQTNK
jgi:hypothetical protein